MSSTLLFWLAERLNINAGSWSRGGERHRADRVGFPINRSKLQRGGREDGIMLHVKLKSTAPANMRGSGVGAKAQVWLDADETSLKTADLARAEPLSILEQHHSEEESTCYKSSDNFTQLSARWKQIHIKYHTNLYYYFIIVLLLSG